jgi:hypothetical protein
MESGRPLVKCDQHGLHYDPNVHAGCVVCRRSNSLPPQEPASLSPQATSVPAGGPASFRFVPAPPVVESPPRLMSIVRLLLAFGVLFLIGRMASRYSFSPKMAVAAVLGYVLAVTFLAALPLALRRYRSLAAFSWLLLIVSSFLLFSDFNELSRAKPELEVEAWQMRPVTSGDGVVTLDVPGTWQTKPLPPGKDTALSLVSMRGNFAIIDLNAPVASLPGVDLDGYFAAMKEAYVTSTSAQIGPPQLTTTIAGLRGLKATYDGRPQGIPARGFLLVARSATHFHMFMVLTEPGYAKHLDAPLRWVLQAHLN